MEYLLDEISLTVVDIDGALEAAKAATKAYAQDRTDDTAKAAQASLAHLRRALATVADQANNAWLEAMAQDGAITTTETERLNARIEQLRQNA